MNRIKELRLAMGFTQDELAKKIGFNQTAVGKYERNELEPSLATLKKLSTIFECSVDYLIGYSDDFGNIVLKKDTDVSLDQTERLLLEDFRVLSKTEKEQVSEYAALLAEKHGKE